MVSVSELKRLGIDGMITECSYRKGNRVYLEEDYDMTLFKNAKKERGEEYKIRYVRRDNNSIRSYPRYDRHFP